MDTRIHQYQLRRNLLLLEYIPRQDLTQPRAEQHQPENVLLFIGGMYDNFRSPLYVDDLAALFPRDATPAQRWSVFHVQLSSAGKSFGLVSLDRDVEEVSDAITYIRTTITKSPETPVVIMGHSTGCQDSMHYLCSELKSRSSSGPSLASQTGSNPPARPRISGIILQAPVSDREAMLESINSKPAVADAYKEALALCSSTPTQLHSKALLPWHLSYPLVGSIPITLARFLSLASPGSPTQPGDDDYFSSDLSDETFTATFGKLASAAHVVPSRSPPPGSGPSQKKSILILMSDADEHVNKRIDKEKLLSRWKRAIESSTPAHPSSTAILSPYSQAIKHALHDISGASVEARTARLVDMRAAVLSYLGDVVGDVEDGDGGGSDGGKDGPWAIWRADKAAIDAEKGVKGLKL